MEHVGDDDAQDGESYAGHADLGDVDGVEVEVTDAEQLRGSLGGKAGADSGHEERQQRQTHGPAALVGVYGGLGGGTEQREEHDPAHVVGRQSDGDHAASEGNQKIGVVMRRLPQGLEHHVLGVEARQGGVRPRRQLPR